MLGNTCARPPSLLASAIGASRPRTHTVAARQCAISVGYLETCRACCMRALIQHNKISPDATAGVGLHAALKTSPYMRSHIRAHPPKPLLCLYLFIYSISLALCQVSCQLI